jgi:glycosyltransferase involved in cell wall biosynthesis
MADERPDAVAWRLLLHRLASQAVERSLGRPRQQCGARCPGGRVVILLLHAGGIGGAIRSVFNVAEQLARTHDVEIVSLVRTQEQLRLPLSPRVPVRFLDDRRGRGRRSLLGRALSRVPSVLMHPDDDAYRWFTLWTDVLLLRWIRSVRSGVLLTTRPAFSAFAGRVARGDLVLVAQEHTNLDVLRGELPAEIARTYGGLDAVVLLTERDREDYAALLAHTDATIVAIPNSVPRLPGEPLPTYERRQAVVAAGRMRPQKGFDLLISAFALVTTDHPDWVLEVYGRGPEAQKLSEQVERMGLSHVVRLPGATDHLSEIMAGAAVFALSSRYEGLPMVLLEAMDKQMAVVAYDCPTGPRELVSDRVDGVLVAPEDVHALAAALREVMGDVAMRARLGAAAGLKAARYDLDAIGEQWAQLLDGLTPANGVEASTRPQ